MKEAALFLSPCCKAKRSDGYSSAWGEIFRGKNQNKFSFLTRYRDELCGFYQGLSEEQALKVYKDRGVGKSRIEKVHQAWQKNLNIYQSMTMMAIDRYRGSLYRSLDERLIAQIRNRDVDNIFIVSALLGLVAPTDLIPDYELMMQDKAPGNKAVWKYWAESFRNRETKEALNKIFSAFNSIFCFLSEATGYVNAVVEFLRNYDSYLIKSREKGQRNIGNSWGRTLARSVLEHANCPEEVKEIALFYDCKLIDFSSQKVRADHLE